MCRCAEAIARTVLAFLDAVILGCLRSCFGARRRRGSVDRRDAPVYGDRAAAAEVIWDDEEGLVRDGWVHEELPDGAGIDEELRCEASYLKLCSTVSEIPAEIRNEHSGGSPFPTPLVLRDDMETPATAYASHKGTSVSGKRVRTRKQFIYPVLRSIENRLKQTELIEDSSPLASFQKGRNLEADSIKDPTQTSSISVVKSGLSAAPSSYSAPDANASYEVKEALSPDELLDGKGLPKSNSDEKNAALSLSHWVKSSSTDQNQVDDKCPAGDQSHDDCSFATEKALFMTSDLNLDTNNSTTSLPKAWYGNGIPNTTTRYKEDQRVIWHTTPFEQRLLKVLTDEDRCPPRKVVRGELFHLEEKAD